MSTVYFAICYMGFYLAYTVIEIPHMAWASDIAQTADEKSKIFGYRGMTTYLGMLIFFVIPLLPFFETQDITPETLEISMMAAGLCMLPLLIVCIKNAPSASPALSRHKTKSTNKKLISFNPQPWRDTLKSIGANKILMIHLSAFVVNGIGVGDVARPDFFLC